MKKFKFIFDLLLILLFTFFVGYFTNRSGYLVLGGDGYAHATKIKFLVDFWPNINWVYFWGNGIPVFLWYGFVPYVFLVFFYKIFSSAAMAINAVNLLTFFIIGVGIYGIVYEVTESRLAALLAAFLAIPSPGLWYRILVGTTNRNLGDGFLVLSIWFVVKAIKEEWQTNLKPSTILGLAIFTGLAFQSHTFVAMVTSFFAFSLIVFAAKSWGQKVKLVFLTFLPAFLLSFYFLIPFVLTSPTTQKGSSFFGILEATPAIVKLLFYHPPEALIALGGGLLPIHIPLLVLFLVFVFLLRRLKEKVFIKRILITFLFFFFCFIFYGVAIYLGYPANWYPIGFDPDGIFEYLSLIIPVILGLLFWLVLPKKILKIFFPCFLLTLIAIVIWQYPIRNPLREQIAPESDPHIAFNYETIKSLLKGSENNKDFRYAHPATEISLWFNNEYQIPQNREFFPHGVMYPNWRSWQENAIWNPEWDDRIAETKFLLDWFAIRWISFIPPIFNQNIEKYLADGDFKLVSGSLDQAETGVEYSKASPILSASNAPTMLVIGEKAQNRSYDPIMRILAMHNLNSEVIVPIRGKIFLDDYSQEELSKFPLIILYEYRLKNASKGAKLLSEYLKQGGKAIIESSSFVFEGQKLLLEKVLGFKSKVDVAEGETWGFSAQGDLTEGIDFTRFSPPIFEEYGWKYSEAELTQKNQIPVLLNDQKIVIFRQKVGNGEMIWSGLNLLYHAVSYKNLEEARFIDKIIFSLLGTNQGPQTLPKSKTEFVNPQKRIIEIQEPAEGVLLKENYFFNWQASFEKDGRKVNLKIYPAGPDFMYIPFGKTIDKGKVTLFYRRSLMEKGSTAISLISLIGLILFCVYYRRNFGKKDSFARFKEKSVGKISSWWQKE